MFDPSIALGAGGALISSILGFKGADKQAAAATSSAQLQADAANEARQQQADQYQQTRDDLDPWRHAGGQAIGQLSGLLGSGELGKFAPSQFQQAGQDPYSQYQRSMQPLDVNVNEDPGYQFRLQQGQEALEGGAAARGGLFSGQAGKELMQFGQQLGSQEYQNAYNRAAGERAFGQQAYGQAYGQDMQNQQKQIMQQQTLYNMLSGVAGQGKDAATSLGNFGQAQATQSGQYGMAGASALGRGEQQSAGYYADAYQNVGDQLMALFGSMAKSK